MGSQRRHTRRSVKGNKFEAGKKSSKKQGEVAKVIESGNGKYGVLHTFEIGNSGEFEQRVVISNISRKKAEEFATKLNNGTFF